MTDSSKFVVAVVTDPNTEWTPGVRSDFFPNEGESCPSPVQEIVVRDCLSLATIDNLLLYPYHPAKKGVVEFMRSILFSIPREMNRLKKNKSSIEKAEVEGAMHHGLRNGKNAIIHRLGLGHGRHFTLNY